MRNMQEQGTFHAGREYERKILAKRIKELETENDKFEDALVRIDTWAKAYPLKAFPRPDLKKARQVLKAADMTLDAISGDAMRHVLDGVKDIVEQVLEER